MIETATVVLDEKYCRCHLDVLPGKYVLLAVTDNGYGMEQSVIENIFEPFFTTKDMGKGTGLGLATIYGIVKQNKGSIDVYSKVGQGTTFNLYFPANDQTDEDSPVKTDGEFAPGEGETVLVVEDEKSLLALTKRILEQLGYAVLAANSPIEAIQIARAHPGGIQLLMTDVIMPEMNGRDLADRLTVYFPGLKCLFMSGYTADVIAHQGCLDGGIHFIPKPFTKRALAVKLRDVLRG